MGAGKEGGCRWRIISFFFSDICEQVLVEILMNVYSSLLFLAILLVCVLPVSMSQCFEAMA